MSVFEETWEAHGEDVCKHARGCAVTVAKMRRADAGPAEAHDRARLAAAAPELYRALSKLVCSGWRPDPDHLGSAYAALEKAAGAFAPKRE
jgi:hypothetical protein